MMYFKRKRTFVLAMMLALIVATTSSLIVVASVFNERGSSSNCRDCHARVQYLVQAGAFNCTTCGDVPCELPDGYPCYVRSFHLDTDCRDELVTQLRYVYLWRCDACFYELAEQFIRNLDFANTNNEVHQ